MSETTRELSQAAQDQIAKSFKFRPGTIVRRLASTAEGPNWVVRSQLLVGTITTGTEIGFVRVYEVVRYEGKDAVIEHLSEHELMKVG